MVTGCATQRKRYGSHCYVPYEIIGTIHAVSGVISRYVSVLRQINGTRASQYLSLINFWACWNSSGFMKRTVAENSGPVIFPRMVEGAIFTLGLLRRRLTFPNVLLVIT